MRIYSYVRKSWLIRVECNLMYITQHNDAYYLDCSFVSENILPMPENGYGIETPSSVLYNTFLQLFNYMHLHLGYNEIKIAFSQQPITSWASSSVTPTMVTPPRKEAVRSKADYNELLICLQYFVKENFWMICTCSLARARFSWREIASMCLAMFGVLSNFVLYTQTYADLVSPRFEGSKHYSIGICE